MRYVNAVGTQRVVSIVGVDEVDLDRHHISWVSPLGRALMKSGPGDRVVLHAPAGTEHLQILEVRYERIAVKPFSEPPGAEAAPRASSGRSGLVLHAGAAEDVHQTVVAFVTRILVQAALGDAAGRLLVVSGSLAVHGRMNISGSSIVNS